MTRVDTRRTDRAAALRVAVRRVVADRGLHGASMSRIAAEAGVATGTAYVRYADKRDLVLAAYVEAKQSLGTAAVAAARQATGTGHRDRFVSLWLGAYAHLRRHPHDAHFILQVDASPDAGAAHDRVTQGGSDPLQQEVATSGIREVLVELPLDLLYELSLAPAVRIAARDDSLDERTLVAIADACFYAVTGPGHR